MKNLLTITWLLICVAVLPARAVDVNDLLPVEEAFAVSAVAQDDSILLTWDIAPDYYMYRGRLGFTSKTDGIDIGEADLPPGEEKEDEFFGRVETYRGQIGATLPYRRFDSTISLLELEVRSQGCADLGVCYPPHRQTLSIALPAAANAAVPAQTGFQLGQGASSSLFGQADALPVDEAFRFETIALSATELLARWTIADGYYLYRDQIEFIGDPNASVAGVSLPDGEKMVDEHFGDVIVYRGEVEVPINLARASEQPATLMLTAMYQGCKEAGICYPPEERLIPIALPAWSGIPPATETEPERTATGDDQILPESDRLAAALGDDTWWTLLSFFGFGLLLAFTPCVFPMVPILSGIIAGQGANVSTRRALALSVVYVLAMALTYTIAGVIAGYFGYNLQAAFQNMWVLLAFSVVFILLALSMFGFYELQLPTALQTKLDNIGQRQSGGTWVGVAIMGFLSALIVGPCVAPPLAAALIYISQTGDPILGGLALFSLSMGMGTPLILIGASAGKLLPRAGAWMDAVKAVFGVGLLALAIWMLERILPPGVIMLLWGVLAIASGVYMGAFDAIVPGRSGWYRLWKSLGLILVVVGVLELIGAAAGGRDWMRPLHGLAGSGSAQSSGTTFRPIKSVADLDEVLASHNGPAMLDFYADWCVDCKRMDKYTFPEAPVAAVLNKGLAIKADVTANDDTDRALLQHFGLIGPPAILFFDANGKELTQYRVIGYQSATPFAAHAAKAFEAGTP